MVAVGATCAGPLATATGGAAGLPLVPLSDVGAASTTAIWPVDGVVAVAGDSGLVDGVAPAAATCGRIAAAAGI